MDRDMRKCAKCEAGRLEKVDWKHGSSNGERFVIEVMQCTNRRCKMRLDVITVIPPSMWRDYL